MLKESQNCKIIIKGHSEEENSLAIQLENVLQKQHGFMLNSMNEFPQEPNVAGIIENIEKVTEKIENLEKMMQNEDNAYFKNIGKIEQEEAILNMRIESLHVALNNLTIDKQKLEEYEQRLHKIEENEEAPIPNCMVDRTRTKSLSKIKIISVETPEKMPGGQETLVNSHSRTFYKQTPSDRTMCTGKIHKFIKDDFTYQERILYEKISPLIEGSELYKRFSQRSSLKQQEFDPLDYKKNPPEACGYGIRIFKLSKCCTRIDVKHQLRTGYDSSIPVDSILKIIIPQLTNTVLKVQKKLGKGEIDTTDRNTRENSYDHMKEIGIVDLKSKAFIERCIACKWFPFSIALTEGGIIELIAKTYPIFKIWINGINCLLKNKKSISKLKL